MLQFFYAQELAERYQVDEKGLYTDEARYISSNVIYATILSSAIFLFPQRFIEAILFLLIKGWVDEKKNFKIKAPKNRSDKPDKSSKSISYDMISNRSTTHSDDGSTEASLCCEDDFCSLGKTYWIKEPNRSIILTVKNHLNISL